MLKLAEILLALDREQVAFGVIGGVAATIHGSSRATFDLDLCYRRTRENYRALVRAIAPLNPRLRTIGAPVAFIWDESTLRNGLNFTLETDLGDLDLLGEVPGVGDFEIISSTAETAEIFGLTCRIISLDHLLAAKRTAKSKKDQVHLRELEAIRLLRDENSGEI